MIIKPNSTIHKLIKANPISGPPLESLFSNMISALQGKMENSFFVYPIDTGFGKSSSISNLLAEWKAEGFKPEGSVLIAFATKAEITSFIDRSALSDADYAVYVADENMCSLGVTYNQYNQARVLFTTHAMLRHRLAQKSFNSAHEFFFRGAPRTLRIWDEACKRAESIHLSVDDLARLASPLRPYHPDWIEGLEAFIDEVRAADDGAVVQVPATFGAGPQYKYAEARPPFLAPDVADAVKQLTRVMKNRTRLRVCAGNWYGQVLIGAERPLPDDLAPMFILDASARIGDAYAQWGKVANVTIMPPLVRAYGNLTIRIWKTACGKGPLEDASIRSRLLTGIAKTLNCDPKPTLLIGRKAKDKVFDLAEELAGRLDNPVDLSFRNWGNHHGTNEFRDIEQMVVIGMHPAKDTVDKAAYLAATGVDPTIDLSDLWTETRKDRLKHNVLQAFSRGSLRKGENGECGKSVVYLVASPNPDPEAIVREVFPGCVVEEWHPFGVNLTGQAKAVFDVLKAMVDAGRTGTVAKKDVRVAASICSASRFSQVLAKVEFKNACKEIGVSWTKNEFVFAATISPTIRMVERAVRRKRLKGEVFALAA